MYLWACNNSDIFNSDQCSETPTHNSIIADWEVDYNRAGRIKNRG